MSNYQKLTLSKKKINDTISKLVSYLEQSNFQGWEPYDIPEFKCLKSLKLNRLRAIMTQFFRLSPFPLYSCFKAKRAHAKAVTLFARAFLTLYELIPEPGYYDKAVHFLNWLKNNRSLQSKNFSIGNQYQLSMKTYGAIPGTPAPLITSFAIEAFLSAYEISGHKSHLEMAESGLNYLLEELPLIKVDRDQWYFIYHPNHNQFIPNLPAVISGTLAHFYTLSKDPNLLTIIKNNFNCVIKSQQNDGSWLYHPRSGYSDSFHTAFILEALAKFQYYVRDDCYEAAFVKGLSFYEQTFFKPNGCPRHKKLIGFPENADSLLTQIDLRDCGMGLALFSFLNDQRKYPLSTAINLLNWTIDHFRSEQGYFYYQKLPLYTLKSSFLSMQGWMLFGLSRMQRALSQLKVGNGAW